MEKDRKKKNVRSRHLTQLSYPYSQTEIIVLGTKKCKNIVSNQMLTLDGITHLPKICSVIILNKSLKLETSCSCIYYF